MQTLSGLFYSVCILHTVHLYSLHIPLPNYKMFGCCSSHGVFIEKNVVVGCSSLPEIFVYAVGNYSSGFYII